MGLIEARNAISVLAFLARSAGLVQGLGELHKLADEQVQPAIVVVIEPDGAGGPSWRGYAGFLGHIGKSAVAIVVVQDAFAVLRDVQVGEAVAIVVADCHALAVPAGCHSRLLGHVGERAIAIIAIERVAQGRIGIEEIALSAVDQVDVHPPVVVVVEESAARSGGLRQKSFRRVAIRMHPGNSAGGRGNLDEGIVRVGKGVGQPR